MCKASIIVPAYNAEKYIESTIKSILDQDFSDFEIIVVNDGSTDTTEAKVKAISVLDSRVKYIAQSNSGGPATPRNVGIDNAKGDYIFIFDADDLMLPGKLRLSIELLDENPSADLLFTNFSSIDENGNIQKGNFLEEYDTLWNIVGGKNIDHCILESEKIHPALIKINFIGTSGVVLRRKALALSDRFNEQLKNSDDRLFWMIFSMRHTFIFLNKLLHQYRVLKTGISNQSFIKRGPSKIKALEIVRENLIDPKLIKLINKQISVDYISLSYAYKLKGDSVRQRQYALKSLSLKLNIKAIKLFIHSILKNSY